MDFAWKVYQPGNIIFSLIVLNLIYGLLIAVTSMVVKRKGPLFIVIGCYLLSLASYLLCCNEALLIVNCLTIVIVLISLFSNLGSLRNFFAHPFQTKHGKTQSFTVEKIFDRKAMYKNVETAVLTLSKTKTGAIITFERNSSLKDIMTNGVPVNAPVSSELLLTIFYPGTRLHDGAVIIKGNNIVAASVFYTPTTKAFAGKYGSRHRAALGISEVSDAITIVVSEETGRISLAMNGQLETVDPQKFLTVFENCMSEDSSEN